LAEAPETKNFNSRRSEENRVASGGFLLFDSKVLEALSSL
jgi:hypothetical protein